MGTLAELIEEYTKLTPEQADRICYEMWDWLYRHPDMGKMDWPGQETHALKFGCAYCTLYHRHMVKGALISCAGCPLQLAGQRCIKKRYKITAMNPNLNSTFEMWQMSFVMKNRRKYAKQIRDIAKARLKVAKKK